MTNDSNRKKTWRQLRDDVLSADPGYVECRWCREAEARERDEQRDGATLVHEVEEYLQSQVRRDPRG